MGKLYIVRHGETVWNREGRIQGPYRRGTVGMGAGIRRKLAGKRLRNVPIDVAYASDLRRRRRHRDNRY